MRLKEIKPGMEVKCRTKEEAIALWVWFYENGYVREEFPEDGLDNFLSCFSDSLFYIIESVNSWGTFAEDIADVKKVEFSELVIPELTAEEVISTISEMCESVSCAECYLGKHCDHANSVCSIKGMEPSVVIDACIKWKSDHEKKEPEIEWVYRVFGAENYGEKFFQTEEEAIKRCEELAKSQKTKQYARYEHVCRVKAVK